MAADNQRPLAGKRVVVTRASEQAGELIRSLEGLGAEVILLPAVAFAPPEDTSALDHALSRLAKFDWVLFTSRNAVRYFLERCRQLGIGGPTSAMQPRFAAVGPATAQAAEREGLRIARVASRSTGLGLARELEAEMRGSKVLLARSDRGRGDLPAALRAAGAEVVEVVAYRTLAAESPDAGALERVRRAEVDVLTFASPSAFHHLSEQLGTEVFQEISRRVALAAIGPVTAQAIREVGLAVGIEARDSSAAGLAAAIAEYFDTHSPSGARPK